MGTIRPYLCLQLFPYFACEVTLLHWVQPTTRGRPRGYELIDVCHDRRKFAWDGDVHVLYRVHDLHVTERDNKVRNNLCRETEMNDKT
jgi:hypothetical protein